MLSLGDIGGGEDWRGLVLPERKGRISLPDDPNSEAKVPPCPRKKIFFPIQLFEKYFYIFILKGNWNFPFLSSL